MVQLLADESVDGAVVAALRQAGYSVTYVAEMAAGVLDSTVLEMANQSGGLLLTADTNFGELVFHKKQIHTGVVLLRRAGCRRPTE